TIYAAHGAFVILSKKILQNLSPIYNEDMFLFCEEEQSLLSKKFGIDTIYLPKVSILHKEDGSIASVSTNSFELTRDSFMKLYESWY
ncbi:MAG: hypothetical protein LUD02_02680, partial [Tannerellaceae bacterium]|nr:hypothetical protein [Tannerellaceae bacterium]